MDKKNKKEEIFMFFPQNIKTILEKFDSNMWQQITNIRFICGQPLLIELMSKKTYINAKSGFCNGFSDALIVTKEDIRAITELITNSSVYAYSRYINEGYVTLPGGNRVGVVGNCVFENGKICAVNEINSLNFRIAHEKCGVADVVIEDINCCGKVKNTLIISPPGCGKTTLLRDIARNLGTGNGAAGSYVCAIIDERYELACASGGCATLDVGKNNFVISGVPKNVAIPIVTRTMSPDVIIVDELCGSKDLEALEYAMASGCAFIASAHGENELSNEIARSEYRDRFDVVITLSKKRGVGTISKIILSGD